MTFLFFQSIAFRLMPMKERLFDDRCHGSSTTIIFSSEWNGIFVSAEERSAFLVKLIWNRILAIFGVAISLEYIYLIGF